MPSSAMPPPDDEIVVDDPGEPEDDSPPVTDSRRVEIAVYLLLLALALVLGYDNYRRGMGWASDGPQSGYMPFYLCAILAGASLWGLRTMLTASAKAASRSFVTRDQLRRVMQVFVPTLLFCAAMQWLGLYVASFLLIAGFMRFVGRIAWWKCVLTAAIFSIAMYLTFDVAFDVLMPTGPLEALFGK